jgi:chromate reductase
MSKKQILAICGSTRANSINELIIKWFKSRFKDIFNVKLYNNISVLPHFNSGLIEQRAPDIVKEFYQLVKKSDGILICTPEYIFSLPGSLKNVFEWTVSTTLFTNKPVAIVVASLSGDKAFEELTLILKTLGANMDSDAQLLIPGVKTKFNKRGVLLDESLAGRFDKLASNLVDNINTISKTLRFNDEFQSESDNESA